MIVKTGVVTDEMIGDVALARMINISCGGPIVTPWTVNELPDEWIDACAAYARALSGN